MPELAEVAYSCSLWKNGLGKRIDQVITNPTSRVYRNENREEFIQNLKDQTLSSSFTHGKQMLFSFSGNCWLGIHLGMTGSLAIEPKEYVPQKRNPAFTRFNVFLRDRFACQYCGVALPSHELTFDHVIPRSRGGRTTWDNVVAACAPCNLRKGGRMPSRAGMKPKRLPARPSSYQLQENGRQFPPNFLHESWRDYLYWDTELDPF